MTLQQLAYAVALDESRHFVNAAKKCFVAQPTLTLQLKKLEEELGYRLFDRSVQPLKPTKDGELFIKRARTILNEVENLKNLAKETTDSIRGDYRIGIIPTLAPYILPLFIGKITDKYPSLNLEVQELQSPEIIDSLSRGKLDIGLMVSPIEESYLNEHIIFNEPFYLFAHLDHPLLNKKEIHPDEIDGKDLWLLNHGHCFRNQVLNLCGDRILNSSKRKFHFESGSIETLKRMVLTQYGCTLIPALSIDEERESAYIRPFKKPMPAREVSLVVHNSFARQKLLSEIKTTIQQNLPKDLEEQVSLSCIQWRST